MKVHDYTEALHTLILEGGDEKMLLQRLKVVLQNRGHERLYLKILLDLRDTLLRDAEKGSAEVILARNTDEKKQAKGIEQGLKDLGIIDYTITIDPTIIGGFVIEGGEKRIDASYKKSLLALYRSLTT